MQIQVCEFFPQKRGEILLQYFMIKKISASQYSFGTTPQKMVEGGKNLSAHVVYFFYHDSMHSCWQLNLLQPIMNMWLIVVKKQG